MDSCVFVRVFTHECLCSLMFKLLGTHHYNTLPVCLLFSRKEILGVLLSHSTRNNQALEATGVARYLGTRVRSPFFVVLSPPLVAHPATSRYVGCRSLVKRFFPQIRVEWGCEWGGGVWGGEGHDSGTRLAGRPC